MVVVVVVVVGAESGQGRRREWTCVGSCARSSLEEATGRVRARVRACAYACACACVCAGAPACACVRVVPAWRRRAPSPSSWRPGKNPAKNGESRGSGVKVEVGVARGQGVRAAARRRGGVDRSVNLGSCGCGSGCEDLWVDGLGSVN
eukprot:6188779-Pleurochrysis_carterae.AAC.3